MTYDFHIIADSKIISCTLKGKLNSKDAVALALRLSKKASELVHNVLYDVRKIQALYSIMPAYEFSTQLSSMIVDPTLRRVKSAFLYSSGQFDEHWKFLETVSKNRGLQLMVFSKESEAMEWLSIV
jgi:hypothetical protein